MNGIHIFRLAITKGTNTLKTELGIKNGIHRQKISVQAMDLVLFGPPKGKSNIELLKDYLERGAKDTGKIIDRK